MALFGEGLVYKTVSMAEVDHVVDFVNKPSQAVKAAATVDYNRDTVRRLETHMKRLKEELWYVLQQQGISYTAVDDMVDKFSDDAVPSTVADTSDKTDYTKVRYQNIPQSIVNELNELARRNCGPTINRVINLITDIKVTKHQIAKVESEIKSISSARKTFEEKRRGDPGAFDKFRDQLISLSAIVGYIDALTELVTNYPKETPTDETVKTTAERFDHACIMWRRYKRKLLNSVRDYGEKYIDVNANMYPLPTECADVLLIKSSPGYGDIPFLDVNKVLYENYHLYYNIKTKKYEVRDLNQKFLVDAMAKYLEEEKQIPTHYTGIPTMRESVFVSLQAMRGAVILMNIVIEVELGKWSGGSSNLDSNPAIAKVIDKSRELIASPVKRTNTDPTTRDEYLSKTLIDFSNSQKFVRKVRDFLERKTEDLKRRVALGLQDFDNHYLQKTWFRKHIPRKDYVQGMKPIEDAVRERVRARYGGTIPFEDEVNIAKEDKPPVFVKEQYVEQNPDTGEWKLKSDLALEALSSTVSQTEVGS